MKIDNSTEIVSVTLIDILTREESKLFERPKSKCYFKKPFKFKDYYIQLRLDWSDVQEGEPVLDVDI